MKFPAGLEAFYANVAMRMLWASGTARQALSAQLHESVRGIDARRRGRSRSQPLWQPEQVVWKSLASLASRVATKRQAPSAAAEPASSEVNISPVCRFGYRGRACSDSQPGIGGCCLRRNSFNSSLLSLGLRPAHTWTRNDSYQEDRSAVCKKKTRDCSLNFDRTSTDRIQFTQPHIE